MNKIKTVIALAMMWVSVQLAKWPVKWAIKAKGVDFQADEGEELAEAINERNQEIPFPPKCVVCHGTKGIGTIANVTTDQEGNWFMAGSVVVCKQHLTAIWGKTLAVHIGPTDDESMDGLAIMKSRLEKAMEIDRFRAEHGMEISKPGETEH